MLDAYTMAKISGITIFVLLTFQVLVGTGVIKINFKVHKILGYVILGLAFLHGLGNMIN